MDVPLPIGFYLYCHQFYKRKILNMASLPKRNQDIEEPAKTRDNIKVAARKLFAEHGLEAVTVRQIVAEAGAKNGGSLNYYFKSKDSLIVELINDLFNDLSRVWLEKLSELDRKGGPTSVRDIVDIIVRGPDADAFSDPSPTANRFLAGVLFMRRKELADFLDQMNFHVFRHLLQQIAKLHPDISEPVMRQRLIFFAWYVVSVQATLETWRASRKRSEVWAQPDPLIHLVDTATALLETDTQQGAAASSRRSTPPPARRPKTAARVAK